MAINLNVSPYYDDFDANKKFNRVVFKPGVAVQARELTQMQDYFYETIKDFAEHLFVDGAAVSGCEGSINLLEYIKISDVDNAGVTVSNDSLESYTGDAVIGSVTGIRANITAVKSGLSTNVTAKKILYLDYKVGNTDGAGDNTNKRFDAGETLTVVSDDSDRNGDTFVVDTNTNFDSFTENFYGLAMDFVIPEGVLFIQGKFVKHERQIIRLDDYSARVNYFIGVILKEEIVTSDSDGTLLDPATGAFNYNAPGADRTKITTVIEKVPFGAEFANNTYYDLGQHVSFDDKLYEVTTAGTTGALDESNPGPVHTSGSQTFGSATFTFFPFPEDFTAVYKVQDGAIVRKLNPELKEYSRLGVTLAERTYEESGNYVVEPFTLELLEHLKTVKGSTFNTSVNTTYASNQFVNHNGNLYYSSNTGPAEAAAGAPPVHTSGTVTSGEVKFTYAGDSYRFDNSGVYLSNDPINPGDPNALVAKVSPGVAYVDGYRRDFGAGEANTYLKVRKGVATETKEGLDTNLGYGNYFECREVCGDWSMEAGDTIGIYTNQTVSGGSFAVGSQYQIVTAGTTDFTLIGAADSAVGTIFTASGAGTGSGTAALLSGAVTDGTFSSTAAPATSDKIGQCRVRSIKLLNGTPGDAASRYRVFVYDVKITRGNITNARTLYYNGLSGGSFANIILEAGIDIDGDPIVFADLKGRSHNKMVFRCPWRSTKTLYAESGNTLDTQYYYTEEFSGLSTDNAGTFQVSIAGLGSEFSFPYSATPTAAQMTDSFYLVNRGNSVTISGVVYPPGAIIPMTPSMVTAFAFDQMDFDLTSGGGVGAMSGAADLYLQVKLKVTDAVPVTKNLNTSRYVKIRTVDNAGGASGPWSLGVCDVNEIEAIYVADGERQGGHFDDADNPVNLKDSFNLDNGQRDNLYTHASISKKGTEAIDLSNKLITVKFSHFDPDYDSSNGTYFAFDSYPVDDTGATGIYSHEVPYYRSELFGTMDLRDCIDFRPYVKNTAASSLTLAGATQNPYRTEDLDLPNNGIQYPIPATAFTTDVTYYLPRIDKVFIDKFGRMTIKEGLSEAKAKPPVLKQGMQIAQIYIPPFPSISRKVAIKYGKLEQSATFELQGQTKRYTMADIGNIAKRIDRLEYYLALSLMEMSAKDTQLLDANGNDRFKNGIYVNAFDSDLLSDLADPSYNCAYDSIAKLAEPNYEESDVDLVINPNHQSSTWKFMGQHITRPYVKEGLFENRFATKTRNCVGELLFNYTGKMELFPRSDNFASTSTMEPMNLTSNNQAAVQAAAASVNASKNVIGTSSAITTGAVAGVPGSFSGKQTTTTTNFEPGGDGAFKMESEEVFNPPLPAGSTTPNNPNGWFEKIEDGKKTTTTTGNIDVSGSFDTTTTTSSIVQSTTEYLLTASAKSAGSLEFNIGDVVRDVSLLPFMRAKAIGVRCSGLKPKTKLYCFFDDVNVTEFCESMRVRSTSAGPGFDDSIGLAWPTSRQTSIREVLSSGCTFNSGETIDGVVNFPDVIKTDDAGDCAFTLNLPGDRFPVGTRRIFVVDDPTNRNNFITTMAENQYSAFGMHQTTQEVSLTAELYQLEYGSTTGGTSSAVVGTTVTGVENSAATISVDITDVETTIDVTNPVYVFHPPIRFGDPIAQSFAVDQSPTEVFLSRVKVWFRSRPGEKDGISNLDTSPINTGTGRKLTMEIRQCNSAGYPTNVVIGRSTLPYNAIKTTPDLSGGNATNFDFRDEFSTNFDFGKGPDLSSFRTGNVADFRIGLSQESLQKPVVLDPTKEYAFIIIPENNDPNYDIWCSKLGETKIGTAADRVTAEEAFSGILFTSANNRTWTPHQQEDLKFVMYAWTFPTGTGEVEFVNEHAEFVSAKDFIGGKPDKNEPGTWYSFKNSIGNAGTGYSVGDVINIDSSTKTNVPSGIKFEVLTVGGGGEVLTIKALQYSDGSNASYRNWPYTCGVDSIGQGNFEFINGDLSTLLPVPCQSDVVFAQGSTTGSGVGFTVNMRPKKMLMKKVDNVLDRYDFILPDAPFEREVDVTAILNGDTSLLPQVDDLWFQRKIGIKSFYIKEAGLKKIINVTRTNMTLRDYDSTDTQVFRAVTNSSGVNQAGSTFTPMIPTMLMPTNQECAVYSLSGELGFAVGGNIMEKKSYRHRVQLSNAVSTVSPILNPSRTSAEVREYLVNNDYANEENAAGGNARARFISKIVRLADGQEAEDIHLSVGQFTPPGSEVKVYFRGVTAHDDIDIRREKNWVEMVFGSNNRNGSLNNNSFVDMEYKLPQTSLSGGKYFYDTSRLNPTALVLNGGSGYSSLDEATVFVDGGTSTDIVFRTINSGVLQGDFDVLNPGANFNGVAPTIKIGLDHQGSETYPVNTVVADTDTTAGVERIYRCITPGTTNALSENTNPGHALDGSALNDTASDGTCVWQYIGDRATFTPSSIQLETVTHTGFKYFQCKIVLLASNTSVIPRLKQLRMIALQAGVQDSA